MMKNPVVVSIAAGALAGFVGAGVATLLAPSAARAPRAAQPVVAGDPAPGPADGQLRAAVQDLKMQNGTLEQRVRDLETKLAASESTRSAVAPTEVTPSSEEDLTELATALHDGKSTQGLQVLVANALDNIREQEAAEQKQKDHDQMLERIENRLGDLGDQLGLTPYQVKEMRPVLVDEEEKRTELFTAMREGNGDFRNARDQMRTLHDDAHQALAAILTPEQMDQYDQQNRRGPWGRGGGGDAGPGAPGGGWSRGGGGGNGGDGGGGRGGGNGGGSGGR